MTTEPAPTPPTEEPHDTTGDIARMIVHDWLAHLGYEPEQIAATDEPRQHTDECESTEHGWECFDEDLRPFHPAHDEADDMAELVMFVLEHETLAALDARYERVVAERDEARALMESAQRAMLAVVDERDEALAELDDWRATPPAELQGRTEAELRAEIARLRSDLNQATAVVEAVGAWLGEARPCLANCRHRSCALWDAYRAFRSSPSEGNTTSNE